MKDKVPQSTDVRTLSLEDDIATVLEIANRSLLDHRDHQLIEKLTILTGYADLRALQPNNSTYKLVIQKTAIEIFKILRRRKLPAADAARLQKIEASAEQSRIVKGIA